jgi:DNA-directed RNA polymerase subunit omega
VLTKNIKKIMIKKNVIAYSSQEILTRSEILLNFASNRYKLTIKVANRAKLHRYQDYDNFNNSTVFLRPIAKTIYEMVDEINHFFISKPT